jgi:hypothetical protein
MRKTMILLASLEKRISGQYQGKLGQMEILGEYSLDRPGIIFATITICFPKLNTDQDEYELTGKEFQVTDYDNPTNAEDIVRDFIVMCFKDIGCTNGRWI